MSADASPPAAAAPAAAPTVSARTVIDGCFSADGRAPLATVYDVGLAVGFPEQTVRLAIRRMQAAGELQQIGRGRAGTLERTPEGRAAAGREVRLLEFAFAQDAGAAPWDGAWRLHAFTVPESRRTERDALRSALTALGAAPLAPGLYLSPHELREELAHALSPATIAERLLSATSRELEVPGCADDSAIAESLWPAAPTRAAYAPLDRVLASPGPRGDDPIELTARAIMLADALDRALAEDPLLPLELRAADWPPARTRTAFLREWESIEQRHPTLPVFSPSRGSSPFG